MPLPSTNVKRLSFEQSCSHRFALRSYCKSVPIVGSMRLTVREPDTWAIQNLPLPLYCCSNTSDPNCLSTGDPNIDHSNPHRRRCWYAHRDLAAQVSGNSVTVATRLQVRSMPVLLLKQIASNVCSETAAACRSHLVQYRKKNHV
jgi:hypothetical protein